MLPTLILALTLSQQTEQTPQTPTSRIELSVQPSNSQPARAPLADAIRDLAWPIAALIGLVILRKPLSEFVSALGGRATKFSAAGVELAIGSSKIHPSNSAEHGAGSWGDGMGRDFIWSLGTSTLGRRSSLAACARQ